MNRSLFLFFVVVGSFLLFGGPYNSSANAAEEPFAPWDYTTPLTPERDSNGVVTYNGYIYSIGGWSRIGNIYRNDVKYAKTNPDGTLGPWEPASSMNTPRNDGRASAYNGYVYMVGGNDGLGNTWDLVEFAEIMPDGSLGPWSYTSELQTPRFGVRVFSENGYIYTIGGNNGGTVLNRVEYAKINADGTLGSWFFT